MTEQPTTPEENWEVEFWTYGGVRVAGARKSLAERKREHVWFDANHNDYWFGDKRDRSVGGVYRVEVWHKPDGGLRRREPMFDHQSEDREFVATLEAQDRAARTALAQIARERNALKQSVLDGMLLPLENIAGQLRTQQEIDALVAYVSRHLLNAYFLRTRR